MIILSYFILLPKRILLKNPFALFLSASILLHAALLALPVVPATSPPVRSDVFPVDLVAPLPVLTGAAHPGREPVHKTRAAPTARRLSKQNRGLPEPSHKTQREATVSLHASDKKYGSYLAHVRYKIDSVWEYPAEAKQQGIEGVLTIRFSILKDGRLAGVTLVRPSGQSPLDDETVQTIQRAAPFDSLPENLAINRLNVLATFSYQFSDSR